jgi:hypothetical protein
MNPKTSLYSLFCCLLIFEINAAHTPDTLKPDTKINPKKLSFLFSAGYRLPVNKNIIINSGNGLYMEGGINFGPLISKDIVLGFYGGIALKDRFWSTSFNQDFVNDYKASINKEHTGIDSAIIFGSAELFKTAKGSDRTVPGCETRAFHNYSFYYGLIFSFPYKYFSGIKVYMGTTRSHFRGDGYLITKEKDYNIIELRRKMYGVELCVFNKKINYKKAKSPGINKSFCINFYCENCNFHNSFLYFDDGDIKKSIPLRYYTTTSFLNKYNTEIAWGAKLFFQFG